jgi:hypothetical protein
MPLSASVLATVAAIVLKVINAMMLITDSSAGKYFDVRGRRPYVEFEGSGESLTAAPEVSCREPHR